MTYEIKDSPIHGKLLAKNNKIVVENYDKAHKLAERFNAVEMVKTATGNYMVKLAENINNIDECDCEQGQMPGGISFSMAQQPGSVQPETYNQYPDHEVQMARQELYRTAKLAMMTHELLKQVGERQGLEGWVQSKLTRAADYIETVFDYLDYEMRYPSEMYTEAEMPTATDQANMSKGTTDQEDPTNAQQQQPKPMGAMAKKPGMSKTPGMVKMGRVNAMGNIEGKPEMVPAAQVKTKQQAGLRVVGENASAGASSAGGMASGMGGGNGFLNGGPGSITRAPKKRKRTTEAWDMLDPTKPYGLANPRILQVGDDPQGINDFKVIGNNVLSIYPFDAKNWNNEQMHARSKGYMLKYVGKDPRKAQMANTGAAPQMGSNMRREKLK